MTADHAPRSREAYEALSHEQLVARLKVAEDALVLIGWSSIPMGVIEAERSKAAQQMWSVWAGMVGDDVLSPKANAGLDAMVPSLAAERDRIRTETLRRITGDDE